MKVTKIFRLTLAVLLLLGLTISLVQGDGNHDETGMMDMDHDGFNGNSEYMNITGEVTVSDSISISLSVLPTDEMQDMMNSNMDEDEVSQMYQYMNKMNIDIYSLVEYYDNTNDGYTADDTKVSEYALNNETLKQPVLLDLDDKVSYEIVSDNSTVFKMTLDVYSVDQMPFAIKWSYDINYPFLQSNTSLAIIHEVFSMNGTMNQEMMNDEYMNNGGMNDDMDGNIDDSMGNHQEGTSDDHSDGMMMDDHEELSMMFSWNATAIVDGIEKDVTSTDFEDKLVLSIPQGSNIFYDPQISIDPEAVLNADQSISGLISGFDMNIVLISALAVLVITVVVIKSKK